MAERAYLSKVCELETVGSGGGSCHSMTIHCDTAPNGTAQVGIPSCQWQMLTVPPAKPYRYALHLPGTVKTLLEKSGCPLQMVAAVPSPLRAAAERRKPRGSARRAAHREPAGPPRQHRALPRSSGATSRWFLRQRSVRASDGPQSRGCEASGAGGLPRS